MLAYNQELCLCLLSYVPRSIGRKITGLIKNNNNNSLQVDGMKVPGLRCNHIPAERPWDGLVLSNTHGGGRDRWLLN